MERKIDERVIELQEDFAKREQERKELELSWLININYYNGNQNAVIMPNGSVCDKPKRYSWQNNLTYNHIAPIIESRLARFNRLNNRVTCNPASTTPQDELSAKFATKLLRKGMEQNSYRALISEGNFWAEICGTVFYKIQWDKSKGRLLTSDGLREGDVSISVCPPQEIYPDSLSSKDVSECNSIIHAKAYQKSVIENRYGVEIEEYSPQAVTAQGGTVTADTPSVSNKVKEGYVLVIERYSRPDDVYKDGRLLIVAGDKVLYDGSLPYVNESDDTRGLPFVRQVAIPSPSSFFGQSLVERMIPLQKAYNAIKNRKQEFFARMTAGVLLCEDGSVDVDDLDEEGIAPGKVIVYRQGSDKPQMLTFGDVPSEFGEEEDRLLNEFFTVSGVSDFLVSSTNGLSYSGTALNIIMEQTNARLCVTTESIRTAEKLIAINVLRLYKQFGTDERFSAVENASYGESEAFRNTTLAPEDIVFDVDETITTVSDRRSLAKDICDMNLLADKNGRLDSENKKKLLTMLGCEGFAVAQDEDELHKGRANEENLTLSEKKPQVQDTDDHSTHIDRHVRFLLAEEKNLGEEEKNALSVHIAEHRAVSEEQNA